MIPDMDMSPRIEALALRVTRVESWTQPGWRSRIRRDVFGISLKLMRRRRNLCGTAAFAAWQNGFEALNSAPEGVPAHLAARFRALLRNIR